MNYESCVRTNYFKVKDVEKFKAWASEIGFDTPESRDEEHKFALICGGGLDLWDADTEDERDWQCELALHHLADGEVCVCMTIGQEGMRYLAGESVAFDNKGGVVFVGLHDIYERAAEALKVNKESITLCEY